MSMPNGKPLATRMPGTGTVDGMSGITTAADCLARFDEALAMDGFVVPDGAVAQFQFELQHARPRA